jgi:DNA-binding response OmpR family regulator
MKTVLIIDRDLGFVFWLGRVLADAGAQVLPAKDFSAAQALLNELKRDIDLLIVNPSLAGASNFVNALRRSWPDVKILAALGDHDQQTGQTPLADITARRPLQPDAAAATLWLRIVEQVLHREGRADGEGGKVGRGGSHGKSAGRRAG